MRGSSLRGIAGTTWPGRSRVSALQPAERRALAVGVEQDLAQILVEGDRRVGGGVGAAGDAGVDLAEGDLVGDEDRRLEAGAAGLLDVVGGRLGREPGAEHALAGQVAVARVLEHGAAGDLAEPLALEAEAVDQAVEGGGEHVLVGGVRVDGVGAREGDAVAADDGDAAGVSVNSDAFHGTGNAKKRATGGRRLPRVACIHVEISPDIERCQRANSHIGPRCLTEERTVVPREVNRACLYGQWSLEHSMLCSSDHPAGAMSLAGEPPATARRA